MILMTFRQNLEHTPQAPRPSIGDKRSAFKTKTAPLRCYPAPPNLRAFDNSAPIKAPTKENVLMFKHIMHSFLVDVKKKGVRKK